MALLSFNEFERAFGGERSLPDGLVEGTTADDWQAVIDAITRRSWPAHLTDGDFALDAHASAAELLTSESRCTVNVRLRAEVNVNLFLNSPDQILFDFDTAEIRAQAELDVLSEFITLIGDAVHKDVSIYYEGSDGAAVFRYDASRRRFELR